MIFARADFRSWSLSRPESTWRRKPEVETLNIVVFRFPKRSLSMVLVSEFRTILIRLQEMFAVINVVVENHPSFRH